MPGFNDTRAAWRSSDFQLLDRYGDLLQELRRDPDLRRGDWTRLEDISPALIAAVLRAEDRRFQEHAGVDWLAAGKAALTNWLQQRPRGASTLSMQLAALLDPARKAAAGRRDLQEKWDQMQAARQLEKTWSKQEILEAYLNLVSYRGELTGIDAAARGLFDKRPAGLDHSESLLLAALIRAPNAQPKEVVRRVRALAAGLPGLEDPKTLDRFVFNSLTGRRPVLPAAQLAPHLARRWMQESRPQARSSLDAGLQRQVIQILNQQLAYLAGREVQDAAALVLDNTSGEVLAYVSQSSPRSVSPESDGVLAPRQAGSTLKPFLYGLALDRRWITAASALEDAPLSLANAGGGYRPENYDHAHRGLVSARTALASSLNIPAVRLAQLVGLEPYAALLARAGFEELKEDADFYGPALALGSLDVRLEELVNAYRALANGGVWSAAKIGSSMGAAPQRDQQTRLFSRETAWLLGDILSDRQARAATFGLENPLATRFWSAAKTGTSKDMRDNWCVGWSARYTVGVWVGNFSGAPMRDVSGVSGAAPAWAAIMATLHADAASVSPQPPKTLVSRRIEPPGEAARQEWFLAGSEPRGRQWLAATPPTAIVQPARGAILALDPDLPATRQRLTFQASHAPDNVRWRLDDRPLDSPDWVLARGRHRLELRDALDRVLDRVDFEVR